MTRRTTEETVSSPRRQEETSPVRIQTTILFSARMVSWPMFWS